MKLPLGLIEANGGQADLSTRLFFCSATRSEAWSEHLVGEGRTLGCLLQFLERCICQGCRSSLTALRLVVRGAAGTCDLALPSTRAS